MFSKNMQMFMCILHRLFLECVQEYCYTPMCTFLFLGMFAATTDLVAGDFSTNVSIANVLSQNGYGLKFMIRATIWTLC